MPKDYQYAYASYLFKIRPKFNLINSSSLVAFLNSKYGRFEIEKFSMVSNQVNFSPAKFKEMRIPNFGYTLNQQIEKLYYNAFEFLIKSQQLYNDAKVYLEAKIGIKNFKTSTERINIKTFKRSFLKIGRIDSEYYLPKYEDYHNLLSNYTNGCNYLIKVCHLKDDNYIPKSNSEYKYIELANIGEAGEITGCSIAKGKKLPSRARRKVNTGDVIISSIEGSLESCAIVTSEYDNALCSTGFYVINSNCINSETLLVLFKSPFMQNILKQACSGTILTAINKTEFQNIPIPIIEADIQKQISDLVKESFQLKKQAEQLLETAKRSVEIAIEQDEEVGINFINSNLTF